MLEIAKINFCQLLHVGKLLLWVAESLVYSYICIRGILKAKGKLKFRLSQKDTKRFNLETQIGN